MTTTLLGFLSLLVATAKPLRELGIAGAIGTLTAIAVAYSVYPAFLGRWASVRERRERRFPRRHSQGFTNSLAQIPRRAAWASASWST